MGHGASQYSVSVCEFSRVENENVRVEGTVTHIGMSEQGVRFELCDGSCCVDAAGPARIAVQSGNRIIAIGIWKNGFLNVSDILTRCDGEREP